MAKILKMPKRGKQSVHLPSNAGVVGSGNRWLLLGDIALEKKVEETIDAARDEQDRIRQTIETDVETKRLPSPKKKKAV